MLFFLGILSLLVAGSSASRPHRYEKLVERDVVIVGGGSSGTYAAIRLMDEGVSVVVLEKEARLGGHTVTYTDPDTRQPFNLGVIIFHDSPIVRNYFGRFRVGLRKVGDLNGGRPQAYYDFDTGRAVAFEPVPEPVIGMVWSGLVWGSRPDQTSCLHNNRSGRPVRPRRPPRMRLSGFHLTGHVYARINTVLSLKGRTFSAP
ncbi:hypothetical protein BFJ68_g17865 [Fusarium oxysporum]|uniref:Amine oxidase domain-containing protein n=1 Tax=Fusarium oxysporum TaxID=5507 RepID=A0A420NEQ9_FUSOX|nr:hypothetical protein BFJ68_g17865 [Fusarium oxysporum]